MRVSSNTTNDQSALEETRDQSCRCVFRICRAADAAPSAMSQKKNHERRRGVGIACAGSTCASVMW